jgi:hypothetical protein
MVPVPGWAKAPSAANRKVKRSEGTFIGVSLAGAGTVKSVVIERSEPTARFLDAEIPLDSSLRSE